MSLLFLRGKHTVKDNSTELSVDYMTRLAMVGMHPAQEVVVCVNIILSMVFEVHIENMTYATTSVCQHPAISVMPTGNKIQKLSVINSYLKGSTLYLHQVPTIYRESTADIDLANSTFTDGATVHIWLIRYSGTHGQPTNTIMKLTSCSSLNGVLLYVTSYQVYGRHWLSHCCKRQQFCDVRSHLIFQCSTTPCIPLQCYTDRQYNVC